MPSFQHFYHAYLKEAGRPAKVQIAAEKKTPHAAVRKDQIEYQGAVYTRYGKKWVDCRNMVVCDSLQHDLNTAFLQTQNLDSYSTWELIRLADQCKVSASVHTAIRLYERAIASGDVKSYEAVLPRLASCYRKQGQPQKAIDLAITASKLFGSNILAPITLTSIAAAYCDLGQWKRAKACADRAFAKRNGQASPELHAVYERIRANTEAD